MIQALYKYGREFAAALANFKYEVGSRRGVYFPAAKVFVRGTYYHTVNGQDEQIDHNLLTDQGLVYLLSVGLNNGTKLPTWYVSLYGGNYTPTAALTAASYPATANEITSVTEGYTETVRQTWVPTAPTTPLIDNLANKANFTIATASQLSVYGAALHSEATKGAVTGTLVSATRFANTRVLYDTDVFGLAYRVELDQA